MINLVVMVIDRVVLNSVAIKRQGLRLLVLSGVLLFSALAWAEQVDAPSLDLASSLVMHRGISGTLQDYAAQVFSVNPSDKSLQFLGQIFGRMHGVLQHATGSPLMAKLFGLLNTAIWILVGLLLSYATSVAVINTAKDGVLMGREQRIRTTALLRASLAVALLIPKKSGYSLIQVIVMWIVVQGVNLADSMWSSALTYLENGGSLYSAPATVQPGSQLSLKDMQGVLDDVMLIFGADMCMYLLQHHHQNSADALDTNVTYAPKFTENTVQFGGSDKRSAGVCGEFFLTGPPGDARYTLYKQQAIRQIILDMDDLARSSVEALIKDKNYYPKCLQKSKADVRAGHYCHSSLSVFVEAVTDYLAIMQPVMSQAGQSGSDQGRYQRAKEEGWIMGGRYIYALMGESNKALAANGHYRIQYKPKPDALVPKTQQPFTPNIIKQGMPKIFSGGISDTGVYHPKLLDTGLYMRALELIDNNKVALENKFGYGVQAKQLLAFQHQAAQIPTDQAGNQVYSTIANGMAVLYGNMVNEVGMPANPIGNIIPDLMTGFIGNIWAHWLVFIKDTGNPLKRLVTLGHKMIGTTIDFWANIFTQMKLLLSLSAVTIFILKMVTGIVAGLIGGTANIFRYVLSFIPIVGSAFLALSSPLFIISTFTHALSMSMSMIFTLAMAITFFYVPMALVIAPPIFALGALLGIYVPLVPFMMFTLAAIGWFMTVVEAMVAAPLVAFGIAHPEGHEFLGRSEQTLILLTGVFSKPAAMILGLLAAGILSFIGLQLLNYGFFSLLAGVLQVGTSAVSVPYFSGLHPYAAYAATVMYLMVYAMLVVGIVNRCFGLISGAPDRLLRWIGGQPDRPMDQGVMEQVKAGFTRLISAGAKGASDAGRNLKGGISPHQSASTRVSKDGAGGDRPVETK